MTNEDKSFEDIDFELKHLYVIYDTKSEKFSEIICTINGESLQTYLNALVNTKSSMPTYVSPEDFALFSLGTWHQITGSLDIYPEKQFINSLSAYKRG